MVSSSNTFHTCKQFYPNLCKHLMKNQIYSGGTVSSKAMKLKECMEDNRLKLMAGSCISLESINPRSFMGSPNWPLKFP